MHRALRSYLFFLIAGVLLASIGCGSQNVNEDSGTSQSVPELTKEVIDERINDAGVWDVLPENNIGEPISWRFDEDEPKEIVVVDQQINGTTATVILEIKTQTSPRASNLRILSGRIRTEWRLQTGWALRRWEIVETENLSMKYKDVPKPTAPVSTPVG